MDDDDEDLFEDGDDPVPHEVVDRIRATLDEDSELDYALGLSIGHEWARQAATYRELARLADIDRHAGTTVRLPMSLASDVYENEEARMILGIEQEPDPDELDGIEFDKDSIIHGIVEGAARIFREVAPRI